MNFQEFKIIIQSLEPDRDIENILGGILDWGGHLPKEVGNYELIEQKGGEGQGEEYYIVIYLTDHNFYVKADGYYSSYSGVDWESVYEVIPKGKKIIVFERKKSEEVTEIKSLKDLLAPEAPEVIVYKLEGTSQDNIKLYGDLGDLIEYLSELNIHHGREEELITIEQVVDCANLYNFKIIEVYNKSK